MAQAKRDNIAGYTMYPMRLGGKIIYVERDGRKDVYGRTLAALRVGSPSGINAGMQLVRDDLAQPWEAGRAAHEDCPLYWCGSEAAVR